MKRLFARLGDVWRSLIPAPRLAAYLAFGALIWVVSSWLSAFHLLALVYDLALLVIAVVDVSLSPRPRDFEVWRSFEPKMNLGVGNEVQLFAKSRASLPVRLTVRDEVPEAFAVATDEPTRTQDGVPLPVLPRARFQLASQAEASASYRLTPNRRGDFRFGALSGRYPTVLGLWYRQFKQTVASDAARVYPDTTPVRRYELALREGKMRDIGLHLLRLRGRGTEFESLREYTGDDEFKSINWNASARRGKLISTNYEIERDQTIMICLDCGRMMTSMAVTKADVRHEDDSILAPQTASPNAAATHALMSATTPLSKLDCAINAAVLLAHVAASMGDSVGLMLFSDSVLGFLPPRKGRIQTGQIIEMLYGVQPSLVEPDYQVAYEYLMTRRLRRSLVVSFTDVVDIDASRELLNSSAALRKHHNALCVTINNRDVIELANVYPNTSSELYEKAMAQRMLDGRQRALDSLRGLGVGILDVEAGDLSIAAVNRYLDLKARGAM